MTPVISPDRLQRFNQPDFTLDRGGHGSFEEGHCATESADWLTGGEPCIARELRSLFQGLNDRWADEPRQLLKPYILRALGTKDDGKEVERRQILTEWLLHDSLPVWLEAAGRSEAAARVRGLPADLTLKNVRRELIEIRDEAWQARDEARTKLKEKVRAELAKRGLSAAAAAYAADAAYAAAAYAAYAADAAAAAAAADAAAAAAAADAADAAADAAAAGAAAAAAAADAASSEDTCDKVYETVKTAVEKKLEPLVQERQQAALDLLDRLLPEEPLVEIAA